jgi:hypothetical protein
VVCVCVIYESQERGVLGPSLAVAPQVGKTRFVHVLMLFM